MVTGQVRHPLLGPERRSNLPSSYHNTFKSSKAWPSKKRIRSQSQHRCAVCSAKEDSVEKRPMPELSRRASILGASFLASLALGMEVKAFEQPPQGYKLLRDKLDGYSFFLPETWTPLSSSGNEIFYRNPYNVNENLFVSISSPSSSKYQTIDDLKSPDKAAERTKQQYLRELLSTRLGVKRTTDIVSAAERTEQDGRKYYDLELEARSYASRNQLAVSQKEIDAASELEWDRHYITVLGVANKRLYEFRLQTAKETYDKAKDTLLYIAHSFRCIDVSD